MSNDNNRGSRHNSKTFAGRYVTRKKLGAGNFGVVYLADDLNAGNGEGLKVVKEIPVYDASDDDMRNAVQEARLQSQLDHPCVVKFYDAFLDSGYFCIVTEYCEGGDISDAIKIMKKSGKRFSEETILNWLVQLSSGLHYIHSRKILHRDLKSKNVFLKNNRVKIGDFGISQILMETTDFATSFVGTPYYLSPEVIQHNGYNSKADVWSLGCILYELCSQKTVFSGCNFMSLMYSIVKGDYEKLPEHFQNFQDLLDKILIIDPKLRLSACDILKEPFVERHLRTMIQHYQANDSRYMRMVDVSETIGKEEAKKIQGLINAPCVYTKRDDDCSPDLTPKEKANLRKRQQADQKAKEISEFTKDVVPGELARQRKAEALNSRVLPTSRQTANNNYQLPNGVKERADSSNTFELRSKISPRNNNAPLSSLNKSDSFADNAFHSRKYPTTSGVVGKLPPLKSGRYDNERLSSPPSSGDTSPRLFTPRPRVSSSLDFDNKPIISKGANFKDMTIYEVKYSGDIGYTEGITKAAVKFVPRTKYEIVNATLAESYYSQYGFDDVEDTLVDNNCYHRQDDSNFNDSDDETLQVNMNTEQNFYNCLQDALINSISHAQLPSLVDNDRNDLFGPLSKEKKIDKMRSECIKKMTKRVFDKVYNLLYEKRIKQNLQTDLSKELLKLCDNMPACHQVEELVFLEHCQEISSAFFTPSTVGAVRANNYNNINNSKSPAKFSPVHKKSFS